MDPRSGQGGHSAELQHIQDNDGQPGSIGHIEDDESIYHLQMDADEGSAAACGHVDQQPDREGHKQHVESKIEEDMDKEHAKGKSTNEDRHSIMSVFP